MNICFMGFGAAGGHDHAVQLVLDDLFLDLVLSVLRAGKQVLIRIDDIRQGCRIFVNCRNIHDPADIDAAIADKDPDPGLPCPVYLSSPGTFTRSVV